MFLFRPAREASEAAANIHGVRRRFLTQLSTCSITKWQSWIVGSGRSNPHEDVMLGSRVSHRGKDLSHSLSQGDRMIRPASHPVPWVTQCSHTPSGGTDAQAPWCLGTEG